MVTPIACRPIRRSICSLSDRPRPQLRIDLQQPVQVRWLLRGERLQDEPFHSALGQPLHGPHEALQRRDAGCDDLQSPKPPDGGFDQWQGAVALER